MQWPLWKSLLCNKRRGRKGRPITNGYNLPSGNTPEQDKSYLISSPYSTTTWYAGLKGMGADRRVHRDSFLRRQKRQGCSSFLRRRKRESLPCVCAVYTTYTYTYTYLHIVIHILYLLYIRMMLLTTMSMHIHVCLLTEPYSCNEQPLTSCIWQAGEGPEPDHTLCRRHRNSFDYFPSPYRGVFSGKSFFIFPPTGVSPNFSQEEQFYFRETVE